MIEIISNKKSNSETMHLLLQYLFVLKSRLESSESKESTENIINIDENDIKISNNKEQSENNFTTISPISEMTNFSKIGGSSIKKRSIVRKHNV